MCWSRRGNLLILLWFFVYLFRFAISLESWNQTSGPSEKVTSLRLRFNQKWSPSFASTKKVTSFQVKSSANAHIDGSCEVDELRAACTIGVHCFFPRCWFSINTPMCFEPLLMLTACFHISSAQLSLDRPKSSALVSAKGITSFRFNQKGSRAFAPTKKVTSLRFNRNDHQLDCDRKVSTRGHLGSSPPLCSHLLAERHRASWG